MKGSCKRKHVPRNSPLAFNQSQWRSLGNNFGKSVLKNAGILGKTIMLQGTLLWPLAKAYGKVLGTTLKEEWRPMVVHLEAQV